MSLLESIESSALSEWLSISLFGAPTLMAIHSVGMAAVVGVSLIVALRLHGLLPGLDAPKLGRLLDVGLAGFALNLATGLGIFVTRATDYVTSYMFLMKMLLVLFSIGTLFLVRQRLGRLPAAESWSAGFTRRLSAISVVFWFAAVVAGRLIAYLSDLYR